MQEIVLCIIFHKTIDTRPDLWKLTRSKVLLTLVFFKLRLKNCKNLATTAIQIIFTAYLGNDSGRICAKSCICAPGFIEVT